jgi:hypothetical protein
MKIVFGIQQLTQQIQTGRLPVLFVLCLLLSACSGKEDENPGPDPALGPKPVLWNLGVDFDAAFTLEGIGQFHLKFYEFGWEVVNGQTGEVKVLPHFSYQMFNTTEVISPMVGYVSSVNMRAEYISTDGKDTLRDYGIHLKPHGDTTLWLVEVDHLTNLAVARGDDVDIGDLLGNPTGSTFELMVIGPHAFVCPWQVFAPEVLEETQRKLAKFLVAWDSAKWALPKTNIYHPENDKGFYRTNPSIEMEVPGCLLSEISHPE